MTGLYRPSSGIGNSARHRDPEQCAMGVWSSERWSRYSQCSRRGKHDAVIDGEAVKVCGTHRPEAKAAREAASKAKDAAERERSRYRWQRPQEYVHALRAISAGHNDPRALAAEVLAKWSDLDPA